MTLQKILHVAVVGGGICGLACAVYLARAGIKVDVFESAPSFGEVGAGVHLGEADVAGLLVTEILGERLRFSGPNALHALNELGLMEAIVAHADQKGPTPRQFRFVSGLPGREHILDYESLPEDVQLGIHRAALLESLVELVDPNIVHFDKRCTSISSDGSKQVIHFKDGTTFRVDVILGADGIRSTVRQAVADDLGNKERVVFTRTVAYRALLLWEDVKQAGVTLELNQRPHCIVGVDKHIITFPIKDAKMINIVVFCTDRSIPEGSVEIPTKWVTLATEQEILDTHSDSDVEVQKLLSLITNPRKWSIHAVDPPLSGFVKGHIALVGDAAHGMCPHLGAGVGQGFEDALVLCKLLTHPETTLENVRDVLHVYDRVRRPRANMVLEKSAIAGELYESLDINSDNRVKIQNLRTQLPGQWTFIHHHDIGADLQSAMEMLRNSRIFV